MPLVISFNGASGDYPGCTDLAYSKAISDGTDIIDCPVQMSKDGIPICLSSTNLIDSSNVATTQFRNLMTTAPEIQSGTGIFSFSLTWSQIQTLFRKFDIHFLICMFSTACCSSSLFFFF